MRFATARPATRALEFLEGGGSTGALMRAHDWSGSPLGSPETWPQSLRSVVGLLLQSRFPMFVAWGEALGFLYNDSYAEILGSKHPQALGRRFSDIWPEIWPDISPLIDAAMAGHATYREDLPLVMNRKGYDEQTWFTFSYSPVRDESGKIAGMFCAVSETTRRVLAEHALRESERRLSAFVAASSYALFRINADWTQVKPLAGPESAFDAGMSSEDWFDKHIAPQDQPRAVTAIRNAIATKSAFELEHRVRRNDGSIGWTRSRAVPLLDAEGKIVEWFGAASDVSARKTAEAALRELNETLERRVADALAERKLLADIVEGTNAFVQVADLEYRWLAINRAAVDEFERIFGKRPRVGESMLELLAAQPEHQSAIKAVWSRALNGEEFTTVGELGDPMRARRTYEMRFNVLRDRHGNRVGAYQFVYDVTERLHDQERLRRAEEALRHAQKMESIGQLTGGVAHDFNNLLAVFANGLQVLERNVNAEQRQRVFDGMRRAIARGTGLTHHLLAFSPRRPVNPEAIDLAVHLKGMREILDRSLRGDINVEMRFGSDLWHVEVDAGELELAMLNLCVNSRDAMTGGGTITITAENRHETAENSMSVELVELSITDTGSGMPPEVAARVFEPFFTTKDVGKGSGLGLPQVYGFAQQSGGRVRVDSKVGVGTKVTLLLPRTLRLPAAPEAGASRVPALRAGTQVGLVLLVEDDLEVAALTREMLSGLGFKVLHAASAVAALGALADARPVDVVLSDIMMPGGMSGLELAREMRRRQPHLPIVLTTGYAESAASIQSGEFRVLLKPYTAEALAEALGCRHRIAAA